MQLIALLAIGFSFGSAVLLIVGNLLSQQNLLNCATKSAGFLLIMGLVGIQSVHLIALLQSLNAVHSSIYALLLYAIAPSFYFYGRQLLTTAHVYQTCDLYHALPLLLALLLPYRWAWAGAFLIGAGYLLWLLNAVYLLREQRQRFQLEVFALGGLLLIALTVLLVGFIVPLLSETAFIETYSLLIGLAFFAVLLTLLQFPSITSDVSEAAQAAYSVSTLKNVDKVAVLAKLEQLMQHEKLYRLESLNLELLAEQLNLNQHQLSELINTEFQVGFSRYIRQYRIAEAQRLLLVEPHASILAIGLSVGFNSQSNFYAAFHELVGMTPKQYRQNNL